MCLARSSSLSHLWIPELFLAVGTLTAGVFLVLASYAESRGMAVACMCVGVGVTGLLSPGYGTNMLDIAPRFSPVTMGISNSCGTVSGFLSPILVGIITEHKVCRVRDSVPLPTHHHPYSGWV